MSSRSLRKLQGRGEIMNFGASSGDEESEIVEPKTGNKFVLLNESDENVEVITDSADEVKVVHVAKKKRNRKKKKKEKKVEEKNNENIDEVLKVLEETKNLPSSSLRQVNSSTRSILTVEHRLLNPENELRKIFGSRAMSSHANHRRRNQGQTNKGVWLVQPQNDWARLGKTGMSMILLDSVDGCQYFKYTYNEDYVNVQIKFLDAVESADHNNVGAVLEKHPYHVDSLLTFSDVYKVHEDIKMSRNLTERALYCLERSFHSCFNLTTGMCRLHYRYQENRSLFLALYKHLNFVSQRGCNRTSLELCKVLLSLDPLEDPLCVILLLDYLSLRASEYQYLIRFATEWGMDRNLMQLPNWSFSFALAHFLSEDHDNEVADQQLQSALLMFPSVLLLLLEKCSVHPDKKVTATEYFNKAVERAPIGLQILGKIFVARNFMLWKDTTVMAWLETNVNVVIATLESDRKLEVQYEKTRNGRYQKPPMNIFRHAMVSEIDGLSSLLPLEIRMGTMLSHDPLPPRDGVVTHRREYGRRHQNTRHPVSLFFQSLLPGYNPEDPLADDVIDEQDNHVGQMRGNVQTLMNAMRDLLNGFQPLDGEQDSDEDFDIEWD